MKYLFICLFLLGSSLQITAQPPSNIEYKKHDFLLNILANPDVNLCKFKDLGLNESNTSLSPENIYLNAKTQDIHNFMIKAIGKDDYRTRKMVYRKIAAAWRVFKEIQYRNECVDVSYSQHNIWAPKIDDELRHKLSIVPLKLNNY